MDRRDDSPGDRDADVGLVWQREENETIEFVDLVRVATIGPFFFECQEDKLNNKQENPRDMPFVYCYLYSHFMLSAFCQIFYSVPLFQTNLV